MTSGAIQNGVPTKVFLLLREAVSCPATPKSASLTFPSSERSTLAAEEEHNKNMFQASIEVCATIDHIVLKLYGLWCHTTAQTTPQ